MGTKYSSQSASGYNATPPSDDGTVSESNKVKWSTQKTKLTDPIKTLADAINTALTTHFDTGPTAVVISTTLGASHYGQYIQTSGASLTHTLTEAATLTAGWYCLVASTDANKVTIGRATGADTINGSAANVTLTGNHPCLIFVNAAANGFILVDHPSIASANTWSGTQTVAGTVNMSAKAINMAEGAAVVSAATCDIWTPADGNTVPVAGPRGPNTEL